MWACCAEDDEAATWALAWCFLGRTTGVQELASASEPAPLPILAEARVSRDHWGAVRVVDPDYLEAPLAPGFGVKRPPIVPTAWPSTCTADPNACSLALRIDDCKSSALFTGDVPKEEDGERAARVG